MSPYYSIARSVRRRSEGKVRIISDRFYTFVHRQVRVQLYPLASMAHKREMKTSVSRIFHPCKFCLEAWLYWMWPSHSIVGTDVECLLVPLPLCIPTLIKPTLLRRP